MHFVSMGNLIFMLLFWVGSYLVTIWLMSRLFPATPVTRPKERLKSESQQASFLPTNRNWPTSIDTFCTMDKADSGLDAPKPVGRGAVMPLIDHKPIKENNDVLL